MKLSLTRIIILELLIITIIAPLSFYLGAIYYYKSPWHSSINYATAVIHPTKGNATAGVVTFSQEENGVRIQANISGLTSGKHGFHVHEFGDCACDDAVCAGDHFNPTNMPHGARDEENRHAGDFGNLEANIDGVATYEYIDSHIALNGPDSIIGRAVIVHAQPDDLVSQPTGNAGARIGCGVIGISKK